METKLNIAEILKYKPENTKLYSPLFGDVYFSYVQNSVINVQHHGGITKFFDNGRYYNYPESELLLFPSKEMRDWEKFAWKKGDVLINDAGYKILFDKWENDDYTRFFGSVKVHCYDTEDYALASKEEALEFIKSIEKIQGGKLNLETLEIEKHQEFKDWDLITIKLLGGRSLIGIFKSENNEKYYLHAYLDSRGMITICENSYCKKSTCIASLPTEEEKRRFFDALAKNGKTWDAINKQIVDSKPKVELKPFDKVLVRNRNFQKWEVDLFVFKSDTEHYHCVGSFWKFCIPYEGNEHLLGTTKNIED